MKLVISQERLERLVKVGELLEVQTGNLPVIVDVMSRFVINADGSYMDSKEAVEIIKDLTIAELKEVSNDFSNKLTGAAVPPLNASDSEEPSSQEQQQPPTG
jgi:hypothetical protein